MANAWKPRNCCNKSELALFEERPVQTDIEGYTMSKVYPLNPVSASSGPIEFHIEGNGDSYIDMDNLFLYVKFKVTKEDGTALAATDKVFPTNNLLHSMFSDITCLMNGTQIEGGNHMYPYKAYLTNLLLFGEGAKKNQLQMSGFAKDTAGKMNDAANTGFTTRQTWISASRTHDLMGPIHLDICHQGKLILPQVDVRLKLTRTKNDFVLVSLKPDDTTDALKAKIKIEEAFLKVRRVQVASDVIRLHEGHLSRQNAVYPYQRTEMYTYTISTGSQSHVKDGLFAGQMPKLLVMGFVNNDDYNGKYESNPYVFRHKNVNYIGLLRDGMPIPHMALTPDFANLMVGEEYMNLMDAMELGAEDGDIDISRNDFANGYSLFVFNLSPDKAIAGHGQPMRDGNLRIELKFKQALDKAINVVLMAIFDGELQISRLRKVTLDN